MKILIKPVTAAETVCEPYDDEMWNVRYEEVHGEIMTAFREGYLSKADFFHLMDCLENITPDRPYENLSDEKRQQASDYLDTLSNDVRQYMQMQQ